MNGNDTEHPSLELLKAFDLGHLRPSEWTNVEKHVASCERCLQTLESLPDDTLVELLQASAGKTGASARWSSGDTLERNYSSSQTPDAPAGLPSAEVPPELADHPRYRVGEALGSGGMGVVFKAEHLLMNRVVALKVIHKSLTNRPAAIERFRQEVRMAARLAHPNIVTSHDADQAGDVHFLVMEFVEGASLDRIVRERGPLPVPQACEWIRQAALGLQHAFERGMVHRDLKPQNLLLTNARQIKILDFGLARLAWERDAGEPLTPAGTLVGTPDYMAPEQGLDPQNADIRADIYGLGCTFYYLLAGRPPFSEGTLLQKLFAHQDKTPQPLCEVRADIPPELSRVVDRLLAKDPAQRYQTPAEVARDLTPFTQEAGPPRALLVSAATVLESPSPFLRRRRFLAAGTALIAGAGLLGYGLWRWLNSGSGVTTDSSATREGTPGEIRLFSTSTGAYTSVGFSTDCKKAVTALGDGSLELWDLSAGQVTGKLLGHTAPVLTVAFSADGRRAISGARDGMVLVWDLERRSVLARLKRHSAAVRGVGLLQDGIHAVSGGDDGRLVFWDVPKSRALDEQTAHNGRVTCVALSQQDGLALTGCTDRAIRLWSLAAPQRTPLEMYQRHTGLIESVVLGSERRYLLSTGADEAVILWLVHPNRLLRRFPGHQGPVLSAALWKDSRRALTGGADKTVRLWDLESGAETARFEGHKGDVVAVAFCPDGRRALSGSRDGTIRLWQLPQPENHGRRLTGHKAPVLCGAITPDGKTVVTGSADATLKVWDAATGQERITLKGHTAEVWSLAISADGKTVVSGSADTSVKVWEVAAGKVRKTFLGHDDLVRSVALTPDEKTIVSGSADKTVKLWDVAGGKARETLTGHSAPVQCVALSRDGRTLASGSGALLSDGKQIPGKVLLWDVATGKKRRTFKDNTNVVQALAFSSDGQALAGSQINTVEIWDLATGATRQTLRGHRFQVSSIALTADGKTVVTGNADKTIKIWDAATGKTRATLSGHLEAVEFVAISADGKTLVSGGDDLMARVWDLPTVLKAAD